MLYLETILDESEDSATKNAICISFSKSVAYLVKLIMIVKITRQCIEFYNGSIVNYNASSVNLNTKDS